MTLEAAVSHADPNDRMFIAVVAEPTSGWLSQEAWDWINSRLRKAA
jgi:hypothetical protein